MLKQNQLLILAKIGQFLILLTNMNKIRSNHRLIKQV
jgi:hypothetical protein